MKFKSPFGIGEIVCTKQLTSGDRIRHDLTGEVIGVTFAKEGQDSVLVRVHDGRLVQLMPSELIGDPEFDQDAGRYLTPE